MAGLTRELAGIAHSSTVEVKTAGLDLEFRVGTVNSASVIRWGDDSKDARTTNLELVAMTVCDTVGDRLFTVHDAEGNLDEARLAEAVEEVAGWPAGLFHPALNAALDLNGLASTSADTAGN